MRRGKPEALVAFLVLLLLGSYVWYTQSVVRTLSEDAARSTDMYRRVFRAQSDTTAEGMTQAPLALSQDVQKQGVPIIVQAPDGQNLGHANLPFDTDSAHPGRRSARACLHPDPAGAATPITDRSSAPSISATRAWCAGCAGFRCSRP